MIRNVAYINGVDISTFGAVLVRGAYEALLTPAPNKASISNKSRFQHGSRVIANTDNTRTDERDVSFSVFIEGNTVEEYLSNYESFLNAITNGVFSLYIPTLHRTFRLVYSNCTKYGDYGVKKGKFTLKFREPNVKDRSNEA